MKWVVATAAVCATAVAFIVTIDPWHFFGVYCAGASSAIAAAIFVADMEDKDDKKS